MTAILSRPQCVKVYSFGRKSEDRPIPGTNLTIPQCTCPIYPTIHHSEHKNGHMSAMSGLLSDTGQRALCDFWDWSMSIIVTVYPMKYTRHDMFTWRTGTWQRGAFSQITVFYINWTSCQPIFAFLPYFYRPDDILSAVQWRHNEHDGVSNPSLTSVYSTVHSRRKSKNQDTYQIKRQSSASLAFVRGNSRSPVNAPHKGPLTRKMLPFNDVIMVHKYFVQLLQCRKGHNHIGTDTKRLAFGRQ